MTGHRMTKPSAADAEARKRPGKVAGTAGQPARRVTDPRPSPPGQREKAEITLPLVVRRAVLERLSARAIREGRNLPDIVAELLDPSAERVTERQDAGKGGDDPARVHGSAIGRRLEAVARAVTAWTGSSAAFAAAFAVVLVWAALGPVFHFSDTWQLVINTGTTIVTFLMVFLIQRAQNKDSRAIHLKLNELVAAVKGASNRLINVEGLTEEEIQALHNYYTRLVVLARKDEKLTASHSVEEAAERHLWKREDASDGCPHP